MVQAHSPRERLNHLLELAARGPAARVALLDDLADLLLDWPKEYALAMRVTFETLLEKTAREVDGAARAALAARLFGHDELPLSLLNAFFLDAPPQLRARILARNEAEAEDGGEDLSVDGSSLVDAARRMNGAFAERFAKALALSRATAEEILADPSAQPLAIVCKAAGIDRAAFSALALLSGRGGDTAARLASYERIPRAAAQRLTRFWRNRGEAA